MDVPGLVVRTRRWGDLSQRELADRVGVSQPSVAAIEGGRREVSVTIMTRMLEQAGLRLAVIDADGAEVRPVSADVVRDNAGRRFPAHLDVAPPDRIPSERLVDTKPDRATPQGWYHQRDRRDEMRGRGRTDEFGEHPTFAELEARRRARLYGKRAPAPGAGGPVCDCDCPTPCWTGKACVAECPCQCEPAGRVSAW